MYLYETHLHTNQASACAICRGSEYIKVYRDLGFTGIMVTDHFFNSNTALDRRKSWSEWVNGFCSGYEDARNEGERRGLDVFFGWEETFDGDDFLIYGLDKAWLLEHPEMIRWTREEQFREVRRYGGCIVHAHPFRQHTYISTLRLSPCFMDAVEAANAGNHDGAYDAMAMEYARILDLPVVAGSDAHTVEKAGKDGWPFGIEVPTKFSSVRDYVSFILNKQRAVLHIPPGRCDFHNFNGDTPFRIKTEIRDRKDRSSGRHSMSFNDVTISLKNYLRNGRKAG